MAISTPPFKWPEGIEWLGLAVTVILAGLGGFSAFMSIVQPKSATPKEVDEAALGIKKDLKPIADNVNDLSGQVWAEGQASAERDQASQDSLSDLHAKLDALKATLAQTTPTEAGPFAEAFTKLVDSGDAADVERAREIVAGRSEHAADEIIADAEARDLKNAERYRQAARIYAITSPGKAKAAYEKAVTLDPSDFSSWIELGRLRGLYQDMKSAKAAFESAKALANSAQRKSDLHLEFGNLLMMQGDFKGANDEFLAALKLNEASTQTNPSDTQFSRDWMISINNLGTNQVRIGRLELAKEYFQRGLNCAERLCKKECANLEARRDLAFSHGKLAHVEQQMGDAAKAKQHVTSAEAILRLLLEEESQNNEVQRDLAIMLEKLGNIELSVGNLAAARSRFKERNSMIREIAVAEPENLRWQRDVAVGEVKIARVEVASNRLSTARDHYSEALAISEDLVVHDNLNSEFQHDVFAIHGSMGSLASQQGNPTLALTHFQEAERVIEKLTQEWPDHPGFANDLQTVRQYIKVLTEIGRDEVSRAP